MKKVNVKENKTIFARMLDSQGILIDPGVVEYKVENIDKIAPEVVVTTEKTKYTILEENEKVDISYSIFVSLFLLILSIPAIVMPIILSAPS